jgi:hypothetical protein
VTTDAANDRIHVTTVRETVTLPSRSGRALVAQIRGIDSARAAVAAFEAAGAGGAVTLDVTRRGCSSR